MFSKNLYMLSRRFCFFLDFFLLFPFLSVAQSPVTEEWVARYNGPRNHIDAAYALALDSEGNVYVTGPSEGRMTQYDYATIKYDTNGNQIWVARYDGPKSLDDWAEAIAVDDSGNVYVTGYSEGSRISVDFATIKYDKDGNQLWVKRYKGPGHFSGESNAIALDSFGNIYVTGFSEGSGTYEDYATIKYDTNGNQLWVARYDGPANGYDYARDLALDSSGNVYVTGYSEGSGRAFDYTTIKYDADGNQIWVARYDGPVNANDLAYDLALDSSGNVYVTGYSVGSGTEEQDYTTIKYDTNGNQLWVARYDGPVNGNDKAYALALDASGAVYVTGYSDGSGTELDYATIKYDTNGNQIWVRRYDGPMSDDDFAPSIASDSSGNVYVTGRSYSRTAYDYATIKYDIDGNQIWVKRYNGLGNGSDWAEAIAVDSLGNVYVTGDSEGRKTSFDCATIKYSQSPSPTVVCRTDRTIYDPWERVQVLADVDNPGDTFSANLLGGVIVIRTPPKKPLLLTGEVITETIYPRLNPDILLYLSPAVLTAIAPRTTHGAFCVLYTQEDGILALDTSRWGLTPPLAAQDEFFDDLIRNYIQGDL